MSFHSTTIKHINMDQPVPNIIRVQGNGGMGSGAKYVGKYNSQVGYGCGPLKPALEH